MAADVILAAAVRTPGTYDTTTQEMKGRELVIEVDVDAITSTPSLAVEVLWSNDGGTEFFAADPADSFAALTTAGSGKVERFDKKGDHYKVRSVITGGTNMTHEIRADYE